MTKIVINTAFGDRRYGGFSLSYLAWSRLRDLGQPEALAEKNAGAHWPAAATPHEPSLNVCGRSIPRNDSKLVQVVQELGKAANGHCAELKIVEIPGDVEWEIVSVGGVEHVSEKHRTWC